VKVAYISPLPPEHSGIADYSALLLPSLQTRADVRALKRGARRLPRGTDLAVYHIGNNPDAHGWILDLMHRYQGRIPALVVLHDFVLHHLVAGTTVGRGDAEAYRAALHAEAGVVGRLLGHAVVDGLIPPLWEVRPQDFPLAGAVLGLANAAVVHSRYVEQQIRKTPYRGPVHLIPMPVWPDPPETPDPAVAGLPARVIIGSVGYLNPSKRIPQLLAAFARLRASGADSVLVLAGAASPGLDLESALARHRLELGRDVIRIDHVPEARLWALLAAFDVCVGLRAPTMGETSGIALRALALGRPLVVSDLGWFAELPNAVVAKVPVDEREVEVLESVLRELVGDAGRRAAMGAAGAEYVRREHDLARTAELYLAAIEETAGGVAVEAAVLNDIARAAQEIGIDPYGTDLSEVGRSVREVGLGG
jgi:glycosyltransferase involved in cell wall biosynthesis